MNHENSNLTRRSLVGAGLVAAASAVLPTPATARAGEAARLRAEASESLARLYASNDRARGLGEVARATLVFPKITKAGFMVGGLAGKGVLSGRGQPTAYYRIVAGTYGLQAGAQTYSYALFFITESSLDYLRRSNGWSIGSGPSVVVVDEGMARSLNTTTLTQDVYAMIYGQRGLMAGLGLEGAKISTIELD